MQFASQIGWHAPQFALQSASAGKKIKHENYQSHLKNLNLKFNLNKLI